MINNYLKKIGAMAALVVLSCFAGTQAVAQAPLVTYSFIGATGSEDSLAADAQPANGRFYHVRRGSALTPTNAGGYISSNNWPTTFDANGYYSVGGTPNVGFTMDLTSLALTFRRSGTGPQTFEIRSSLDNYTAVLKTVSIPTLTSDVRDSLALPAAFSGLTSKVEFRIYGYGGTATGGTGRLKDIKFYGSIAPTGGTTSPAIAFASSTGNVAENVAGGTTNVQVTIANPSATTASSVDVALGTGSTAVAGTHYNFTPTTLTWAAGDNAPKTVTVSIIDNSVYQGNKTVVLNLTNASTGVNLGTSTFTLTIVDNEIKPIPTYTVAQITTNNPVSFLPDSLGVKVKLVGTLYGNNQRTTGLQLTLIDATGGVGLFTTSAAVVPAVAPVEGDSVRAIGTVAHFNGLTQLTLDSIVVLGTGTLIQPTVVNGPLTEAHESELITLANPVSVVDPNQWTNTGSGFTVQVTDGVNIYDMRIVATSDIFGTPAPTGTFVLTGIGGQFDSSNPHDSGYQIIPRRLTDLRIVTGLTKGQLETAISVYPNPVREVLHLNVEAKNATVTIVNALGQEVATVPASAKTVNVANLPAGVYLLKVSAANTVAVKRFVKIN